MENHSVDFVDKQAALERVLASPEFAASSRARDFLRYVGEEEIAGRADRLKGYNIATAALGRRCDYNSDTQSAVRVQARRLRDLLAAYYFGSGASDDVVIDMPLGTYVPNFTRKISAFDQLRLKLRESEEALRALTDNLPDSVVYQYTYDAEGKPRFLFISAGITKLCGVTVEEVLADAGTLQRQIPPEYRAKFLEAEQVCLKTLSDFDTVAPMRRPDGELRWMRMRSRPIPSADGLIVWHGVQTDITERKRMEDALAHSEKRLSALTEAFSSVVFRMSPDWAEMRQLNGAGFLADVENVTTDWLEKLIPVEERDRVVAAIDAAIRSKSVLKLEHKVIRFDGRIGWTFARVVPVLDQKGDVIEWFGVANDVTGRKQAEDAQRAHDARSRLLIEKTAQAFWETDPEGRVVEGSQSWTAFTRQTAQEMAGAGWMEAVHPDDRAGIARKRDEAVAARQPLDGEYRLRGPDGNYRWTNARAAPLLDDDGAILKWIGMNIDIDARKRAEQEALEIKATLEAALSAMTDAVFISDAEGRFIHFNEAFATIHRFPGKAECARMLADYPAILEIFRLNGERLPLEQWSVPRALRGETATGQEYVLRRKDTGEQWVGSYSLAPIRNATGAIVGAVVTARDITRIRQTEAALRKNEQMLATTVDAALEGIVTADARGVILSANPASLDMFGYEADELVGRTVGMLIPESHRAACVSQIGVHPGADESKTIARRQRVQALRKNGEIFPLELTVRETCVDDQRLFITFLRDLPAIEAAPQRTR